MVYALILIPYLNGDIYYLYLCSISPSNSNAVPFCRHGAYSFLTWHCLQVVPLCCPKFTLFCKHCTRILLSAADRFGGDHFHVCFFLDPMTIAVLWQMAVIPFGHDMPPMTFSSKVKDKEAVILKGERERKKKMNGPGEQQFQVSRLGRIYFVALFTFLLRFGQKPLGTPTPFHHPK
ncbi:hypothetical protein VNO78_23157 [Psophocarpus tetragonolobus]|uniref:Uncharacterized protein n=1 Tax=Psophocarpus tetragonolobus TaxID=3891 RepID=A0AAN9S3L6_PSOTE